MVLACLASLIACERTTARELQNGDIIFHTSRSSQSLAIQKATHSAYSHMGIIFFQDGKPFVFEAIATVRSTPLSQWIQRGEGNHFVVKRLKDSDSLLTPAVLKTMREAGEKMEGKPYDLAFGWSDSKIYCSELVWKIYQRGASIKVGKLQILKDFDLTAPEVQLKLKERYGDSIPLNETVVSPAAIFNSPLLVEVMKK